MGHARSMPGTLQGWIDSQIPAANLLVYNRSDLPCPGVARKLRALVANLHRDAHANGPFPAIRRAHARSNMISHPLVALPRPHARENVKARLKPLRPTLRDLDRFVFLVIRRQSSVRGRLAPFKSEVAVQFNHGIARRDGVRSDRKSVV